MQTEQKNLLENKKTDDMAIFLNEVLANEYALFTKTLNYHWNVTGPRFSSLHTFLDEHYHNLLTMMDGLAERIRILGQTPKSTVKEMMNTMELHEKNGRDLSSNEMLDDLYQSHSYICKTIRQKTTNDETFFSNDPGTEDFLIGLLQKHEKMCWMIRSHLD